MRNTEQLATRQPSGLGDPVPPDSPRLGGPMGCAGFLERKAMGTAGKWRPILSFKFFDSGGIRWYDDKAKASAGKWRGIPHQRGTAAEAMAAGRAERQSG